jgi:hypothetical protein
MTVVSLTAPLANRARAEDPQHARELFQEGNTFFDVGQFDKAIDAWQRGYKEKADPGFLYNIAQAYRLSGDPAKAIFFYHGFLRNSPKAPNRADVEQKIAALQKQLEEQSRAAGAGSPGKPTPAPAATEPPMPPPTFTPAPAPAPPPMFSPAPVAPPAPPGTGAPRADSPPPITAVDPAAGASRSAPMEELSAAPSQPPPAAADDPTGSDLGAGIGFDAWGKSVNGSAEKSFAFALSGGHSFWLGAQRRLALRLGGVLAYTFLSEASSTTSWRETFWSFIAEPTVRYRFTPRFIFSFALGIGGMSLSNLQPRSALIAPSAQGMHSFGTQGLFVLRPALNGELGLSRGVALTVTLAFPYSPKPNNFFFAPIARTEFLAGLAYRF